MKVTRLGLQMPVFTYPGVADEDLFERVAQLAGVAESSGFDSVWVMDHFYQIAMAGPREDPMLESYTLLAALAARTERVHLGALVTGVTYRNPAHLAKIVTTLDVISRGRAILGIGAAWNDDEHDGYGFSFPEVSDRFERLEEALVICRAMFREESPTFSGRHYAINGALNFPRPVQPGGIPILVGGSGEQKTLRLVARYADACNLFGDLPTIAHKLSVLDRHCEEAGRDPAEIARTRLGTLLIAETAAEAERKVQRAAEARGVDPSTFTSFVMAGDPDSICEQVGAYLDAGLDGMMFNMADAGDLDAVRLAGETLSGAFG